VKTVQYLSRLFIFLLLIGCAGIWALQQQASVHAWFEHHIKTFIKKEWKASLDISSCKPNFFTLSITLNDGHIRPLDQKKYSWDFKQTTIHINPIRLLTRDPACIELAFDTVSIKTNYEKDRIDFAEHIKSMLPKDEDGPIVIPRLILISQVTIAVTHPEHTASMDLDGKISIRYDTKTTEPHLKKHWFGTVLANSADIKLDNNLVASAISGMVTFAHDQSIPGWVITPSLDFSCSSLEKEKIYSLNGEWSPDQKKLTINDNDNALHLTTLMTPPYDWHVQGQLPLSLINKEIKTGSSSVDLEIHADPSKELFASGDIKISHYKPFGLNLRSIVVHLFPPGTKKVPVFKATTDSQALHVAGTASWDFAGKGSLRCINMMPLSTITKSPKNQHPSSPLYIIKPGNLMLNIHIQKNFDLHGAYRAEFTIPLTKTTNRYTGTFKKTGAHITTKGKSGTGIFALKALLNPTPHLTELTYKKDTSTLVYLKTEPSQPFILQGPISWTLIQSYLSEPLKHLLTGNRCTFHCALDQKNMKLLQAHIKLARGTFYIPEHYNLIQAFSATIWCDIASRRLAINDAQATLSKGKLSCKHAYATLTPDFQLNTLYVPMTASNCFFNWKRDFYSILSGDLIMTKQAEQKIPYITGNLIIKKALLRENIVGGNEQYQGWNDIHSRQFPLGLDVNVVTEKPIRAKTSSLQALASLNLTVHCTPEKSFGAQPYIVGTITLEDGSVNLLGNNLKIEQGKIQFLENKPNDPFIDIIAKNRINKYIVSLQTSGSLQNPTVFLESTPDLTEEQIMGLLCTGSENTTLESNLSALLMKNISTLMFKGKKEKSSGVVDKLLKTLKYVQISPDFSDAINGGPVRGSIAVNVKDKMRASIKKDITSQNDDFSAQLEYMLSDNINVKVVRDQRGEVGSEVEFRLKL
jgi:hypothetical protein